MPCQRRKDFEVSHMPHSIQDIQETFSHSLSTYVVGSIVSYWSNIVLILLHVGRDCVLSEELWLEIDVQSSMYTLTDGAIEDGIGD